MDSGFPDIQGGFGFIGSLLDVQVGLPSKITEHVRLERATDVQIAEIKRLLPTAGGFGLPYHYEHEWVPVESSTAGTRHQSRPMHRDAWRYFVFSWKGSNAWLNNLQRALNLVPPPVSCVIQVMTRETFGRGDFRGLSVEAIAAHHQHERLPPKPIVVDADVIHRWQGAYDQLQALDRDRHPAIYRAVDLLDQLRRFPSFGHLQALTFFMVLEMLLTHRPNDKEIGDSLAHQIRTKVSLLSRRIPGGLDYSAFESGTSEDKLWSKLYAYRSIVAHGGVPDFTRDLRLLRNAETAWHFLAESAAKLVRYAIDEPDLVEGLKPI